MTSRFEIEDAPLAGLCVLRRKPVADHRGYLERLYCEEELEAVTAGARIVQINRTLTRKRGTVRGMHFQRAPHAEMKLISCLNGEVFDGVVDIRRGSPTFLRWHGEVLNAHNRRTLIIPVGFAHGFQTLSDDCELLYFHTAAYAPSAEGALNASDPRIGIDWPLPISEMSPRDLSHPMLSTEFEGFVF
jgi:dTDP-4-dehydrorhamnose 3,5-epimerase